MRERQRVVLVVGTLLAVLPSAYLWFVPYRVAFGERWQDCPSALLNSVGLLDDLGTLPAPSYCVASNRVWAGVGWLMVVALATLIAVIALRVHRGDNEPSPPNP